LEESEDDFEGVDFEFKEPTESDCLLGDAPVLFLVKKFDMNVAWPALAAGSAFFFGAAC